MTDPEPEMAGDDDRAAQKLPQGVKVVLWLSAAALGGVVWVFWLAESGNWAYLEEGRQHRVALAFSLVLLSACLVWLTRSGGSRPLRGLLTGLLGGLSGMICLFVVWGALHALATGEPPESLASNVLTYSSLVGMLGGLVGFFWGFAVAAADQPQHMAGDAAHAARGGMTAAGHRSERLFLKDGDAVEVYSDTPAHVILMDDVNYADYRAGRSHRYYGGFFTHFPARLTPPHSGYWNVLLDLGGGQGTVHHSIRVVSNAS